MKEHPEAICRTVGGSGICQPLLADSEQTRLRSRVYKSSSKIYGLAPSSLFSRILRFDIEKYQDEKDAAGIATFPSLTSPMQIALLNKLSLNS